MAFSRVGRTPSEGEVQMASCLKVVWAVGGKETTARGKSAQRRRAPAKGGQKKGASFFRKGRILFGERTRAFSKRTSPLS